MGFFQALWGPIPTALCATAFHVHSFGHEIEGAAIQTTEPATAPGRSTASGRESRSFSRPSRLHTNSGDVEHFAPL